MDVGPGIAAGPIGRRSSLADIGATVAAHLAFPPPQAGNPWLPAVID